MFGMSFGEIAIIAIIAILFLGPDKLPDAMVKIAKFFRSFKKSINEAKETIEEEIHLSELKDSGITYKEQLEKSININIDPSARPNQSNKKPKFTPKDESANSKDTKDV